MYISAGVYIFTQTIFLCDSQLATQRTSEVMVISTVEWEWGVKVGSREKGADLYPSFYVKLQQIDRGVVLAPFVCVVFYLFVDPGKENKSE